MGLVNTIKYRIIYRMKVTALIPDDLISEIKILSKGKNITESLIIVMQEWIASKHLKSLNQELRKSPLKFESGYSAARVRRVNRKK